MDTPKDSPLAHPITLEQKAEWSKVLRSGKFTQTTGCLMFEEFETEADEYAGRVSSRSYCCLGVLNTLLAFDDQVDPNTSDLLETYKLDDGASFYGYVAVGCKAQGKLSSANDCGVPFPAIADIIDDMTLEELWK